MFLRIFAETHKPMDQYIFKGLLFPVFDLPRGAKLLERFPGISQWPEFRAPTRYDASMLIRYIVAAYDKNGLRVYESNATKRKKLAAELAGFPMKANGDPQDEVMEILDGKDATINQMIVRYCKMQRGANYAVLVGMEEVFYGILQKMLGREDISQKEATMFEDYEKKIELRAIEFLNGDKSKDLRDDLFELVEYEKLELRPEDIAERLRQGRPGVRLMPYGDDYDFSRRKLLTGEGSL